jgi:hypothetical protein
MTLDHVAHEDPLESAIWGPLCLLRWVLFKPSALRLYLGRVAPELGREPGPRHRISGLRTIRALRVLALRSVIAVTLSSFTSITVAGLLASVGGARYDWWRALLGVVLGVAATTVVGLLGGITWGVGSGTVFGAVAGVYWGTAQGFVPVAVLGFVPSVLPGLIWGPAWGVALGSSWAMTGAIVGMTSGYPEAAVVFLLAALAGAFRVPFYFVHMASFLRLYIRARRNRACAMAFLRQSAVYLDELWALPCPALDSFLLLVLQEDLRAGLRAAASIARQPFQRWAAQSALRSALGAFPEVTLRAFELLLKEPEPYVVPKLYLTSDEGSREDDKYFSVKLIFAELGDIAPIPGFADPLARTMTQPLRRRWDDRLTRLASVYYGLLHGDCGEDLLPALEAFKQIDHGYEVFSWVKAVCAFLKYDSLPMLTRARNEMAWMDDMREPLRPEALAALGRFAQVGERVRDYLSASSELHKRDLLVRAQSGIDDVRDLARPLHEPESWMLSAVADRWYRIIADQQAALARPKQVLSVRNNYIVGPPVRPESGRLFVGRSEHFRAIEELWLNEFQKTPIVLHGQRRMGKSSILLHLEPRLGTEYVYVLADMQREAAVDSVGAFLHNVVCAIHRAFAEKGIPVTKPDTADYEQEPFIPFTGFLDVADSRLEEIGLWCVLMLDEFEKIEEKLESGVFPPELLEIMRNMMQHRRRFALLFAGSHTLDEMTRRYWSPFFGAAQSVRVSYLDEESARQLIMDPWDGFPLNYEREAVDLLLGVTGCQPHLLQAVCSQMVEHVNDRLRQGEGELALWVSASAVHASLEEAPVAGYYFDAVWGELAPEEQLVISALGRQQDRPERWVTRDELEKSVAQELQLHELEEALRVLERRDMLRVRDAEYRFWVDMVRRWIRDRRPLADVLGAL